jgi:hypothetical protein
MITFDQALEIAKKYDPSQPRDRSTGRWSDKLGLSDRIPLDEGSTLLGSLDFGDDDNDSSVRLAAVRRGDGRTELRFDVGWDDPDRANPPSRGDYDEDEDGERDYQRALAEHSQRWDAGLSDTTARLDLERAYEELTGVEELRAMASADMAEIHARLEPTYDWPDDESITAARRDWSDIQPESGTIAPPSLYRRNVERNKTTRRTDYTVHPAPEGLAEPAHERRWFSEEERLKYGDDVATMDVWGDGRDLYSGVIEGEWADIHWQVFGKDSEGTEGTGDWAAIRLMTRPHGDRDSSYSDLYAASGSDGLSAYELTARGSAKLLKELERIRAAAAEG